MDNRCWAWATMIMLLLILLGEAGNTLLMLSLRDQLTILQQTQLRRPDLPCAAIPTRLILDDPACAQKLLAAMNVTNVRILTNISQLPGLDPTMKGRLVEWEVPFGGNRSHKDLP